MDTGEKHDQGKLRFDLLNPEWLEGITEVITYGASKYGDHNYSMVDNGVDRYYAAAMRHMTAIRKGELDDPESELPHVYHAVTSLLMMGHHINMGDSPRVRTWDV